MTAQHGLLECTARFAREVVSSGALRREA